MAIQKMELAENFVPTDKNGNPLIVGRWYLFTAATPKGKNRKMHIQSVGDDGVVTYKEEHDSAVYTIPVSTFKAKYVKRLTLLKN